MPIAQQKTPQELLAPHLQRKVRNFLNDKRCRNSFIEDVFWDLVYENIDTNSTTVTTSYAFWLCEKAEGSERTVESWITEGPQS